MTKEEEVKEDDASLDMPKSSLSSPTPIAATMDIITNVEAETSEEEKTDKDDDSTLETP